MPQQVVPDSVWQRKALRTPPARTFGLKPRHVAEMRELVVD
jgi:hypothetical protein